MTIDRLNADFMDMQAIALTTDDWQKRRDIVLLTRSFKEHLSELEDALREKDVAHHG